MQIALAGGQQTNPPRDKPQTPGVVGRLSNPQHLPQDVSWRGVLSYGAWGGRKPTRSLTVSSIGVARCLAASAPARSTSSNVAGSSMKAS
jgi:hypothetical protein